MVNMSAKPFGLGWRTWALACGLGLHLAWISCLFHHGGLFNVMGNGTVYPGYYLASEGVLVVSLLAFGCLGARRVATRIFESRGLAVLFAVLVFAGTVVIGASWPRTAGGYATFAVSALLTGVGSAYLDILWGCQLVRHREVRTAVVLCLAYALSSLLYCAFARLPGDVSLALTALLPLASLGLALRLGLAPCAGEGDAEASHRTARDAHDDEYTERDLRVFAARLLACALLFGVVLGAMQGLANAVGSPRDNIEHSMLFMVFLNALLVVAAFYIETPRLQASHAERFVVVYRIALLVMIGALLVSSVYASSGTVLMATMLTGYTFFKILVWTELCQIVRAGCSTPVRMYGFGEACMAGSLLAGTVALSLAMTCMGAREDVTRAGIALCIAALILAYLFVLTERHVTAIEEINEAKEVELLHVRFQDRLDAVTRRFGLTKREAEVCRLFVRGRSTARIAEDLYISSGTVATHLRSIYRKTDVHGRQELLDLIDNVDVAEEPKA